MPRISSYGTKELSTLVDEELSKLEKIVASVKNHVSRETGAKKPQVLLKLPEMLDTLMSVFKANKYAASAELVYLIWDAYDACKNVIPCIQDFLSKKGSFFSSKSIAPFDNFYQSVAVFIYEIYVLCTEDENDVNVDPMIQDITAREFWDESFDSNNYIIEYDEFYNALRGYREVKKYMDKACCEADKEHVEFVTAHFFNSLTETCGLKGFCKLLTSKDLFLFKRNITQAQEDTAGSGTQDDAPENDSLYFYIESQICDAATGNHICLHLSEAKSGAVVSGAPFDHTFNQQWKLDKNGCLVNRLTGEALDIRGREAIQHNNLVAWAPDGSETQIWLICPDGSIRPGMAAEKFCIDLDMPNATPMLYPFKGNPNQKWKIVPCAMRQARK